MPFSSENNIYNVWIVVYSVVSSRVCAAAKSPSLGGFIDVTPFSSTKSILTSNDYDVAITWYIIADDIFTYSKCDCFVFNASADVNTPSRYATCFCLNGLYCARLTSSTNCNFPSPIRMHFCISSSEHFSFTVRCIALIDVNLHYLMAKAIC